jgi:hypothetical protein
VITCHSREIGDIFLLLLSCYYHMEYKCIWIIGDRTERVGWTWTWLGNQSGALVAFVSPGSIKDRSLHGPWSSHRFIVPSIYLLMGPGRLVSLLSWVPALSGPTF